MINFNKLQQEIVLSLVLLTLVVLLIVGTTGVWIILSSHRTQITSTQEQVARRIGQEVDHILTSSAEHLRHVEQATFFSRHTGEEQAQIMFDFLHGQTAFDHLTLYDIEFEPLFIAHRYLPQHAVSLSAEKHQHAFLSVLNSNNTFFGGLDYDEITGEPTVLIALPILDLESGNIVRVVIASLSFRNIWQMMTRETRNTGRSVFLVADDNRVIAHPNPSMVLARYSSTPQQRQQGVSLDGGAAFIGEWPVLLGERTYRVVAEQPKVSILTAAFRHAGGLVLALVSALAAAVLMGSIMSRRITRPLDQLVAGAHQIAMGDLKQPILVSGRNELAILGQQLDQMREKLADLIAELQDKALVLKDEVSSRRDAEESLKVLNKELEQRVSERTLELTQSLRNLEAAQATLVQSEKLAGLGALVAGVAHELNTPIGNALMMASTLQGRSQEFKDSLRKGVRKSDLERFLAVIDEAGHILGASLSQSSRLISSFKQVAVDQTSYQRRLFSLAEVVDEILISTSPSVRRQGLRIHLCINREIKLDSFPGPLGQILLNMINNTMLHAFDGAEGDLWLEADTAGEVVTLEVRDNGKGIPPANLGRIFDPFYTSRLGQGGSGLGLNIVHNLVKGILGGSIEVSSNIGEGTSFRIKIPVIAPAQAASSMAKTQRDPDY